jgi:hypothetical protein
LFRAQACVKPLSSTGHSMPCWTAQRLASLGRAKRTRSWHGNAYMMHVVETLQRKRPLNPPCCVLMLPGQWMCLKICCSACNSSRKLTVRALFWCTFLLIKYVLGQLLLWIIRQVLDSVHLLLSVGVWGQQVRVDRKWYMPSGQCLWEDKTWGRACC